MLGIGSGIIALSVITDVTNAVIAALVPNNKHLIAIHIFPIIVGIILSNILFATYLIKKVINLILFATYLIKKVINLIFFMLNIY
jgi:hypothetical protein